MDLPGPPGGRLSQADDLPSRVVQQSDAHLKVHRLAERLASADRGLRQVIRNLRDDDERYLKPSAETQELTRLAHMNVREVRKVVLEAMFPSARAIEVDERPSNAPPGWRPHVLFRGLHTRPGDRRGDTEVSALQDPVLSDDEEPPWGSAGSSGSAGRAGRSRSPRGRGSAQGRVVLPVASTRVAADAAAPAQVIDISEATQVTASPAAL